ncbi:hypothetical protein [Clostridium sp. 1001271B_151109_B4]|uniref:tetratricopeptide repeat protein n=1 Tax=Clostridium sp. 1001271B_151109_B4 TaxID=2787148 RepID=UPI0018A9F8D1|nr:hypothetical protein [Clostridium sp. 1001271B_151109_B4]
MSCWTVLGITPTKNIDKIKEAYSNLSNSKNFNNHNIDFKTLKSAYNKALSLAKVSISDLNLSLLGSSNYDILSAVINSSMDSKSIDTIEKFIIKVDEIYTNPLLRFKLEPWINLLTSAVLETSSSFDSLNIELIKYLNSHKYLPNKVYQLLDSKFKWTSNKIKLKTKLSSELVDSLINYIENPLPLTYNYLDDINAEKLDEYLELREKSYLSLQNNNLNPEKECLFAAYSIYTKDLDLVKIIGTYYLNKNDNLMALNYFREAININCNDLYSLSKFGHLLTVNNQYSSAISYLERYIKLLRNSIDMEAIIDLAHSYHYSYELQKAKYLYDLLLTLRPWDLSIRFELESIKNKISTDDTSDNLSTPIYKKYINHYIDPFNYKLKEIYNDFSLRINEDSWKALFALPIASDESLFYLFEQETIKFITTNKNIPKNIYDFLNIHFKWTSRHNELLSIYPSLRIDILFNKLYFSESLSYDSLKYIESYNLEEYIELRSLAYDSVYSDSKNAEEYLNAALNLFNGDFELYKIYGQYYLNNNSYDEAIKYYKLALSFKDDDYYSICSLALLLTKIENYKEALFYLNKSVNTPAGSLLLDNEDFLTKYAISFYYTNNLINAKKYFKKLAKLNSNLKFVNIYLKNINDRLSGKKKVIIPISVIENPERYSLSLSSKTKNTLLNFITKFKHGLVNQ